MNVFDKFERFGQKTYNGQDILKNHILTQYPKVFTKNGNDYEQVKKYAAEHEYVWLVEDDFEILRSFPWWFKPNAQEKNHVHQFPYVYKSSQRIKSYTKVQLVPTRVTFEGSVQHNHICGIYDVYCGKDRFDIFFVGDSNSSTYDDLVDRFRNVKIASSHEEARLRSTTDMFWLVPDDVELSSIFKFNYVPDDWSQKFTHVFGNGDSDTRDGIALFPKAYTPTDKELTYRYYANKKELTIVASKPKKFPIVEIKSFDDYKKTLDTCTTDLFWYVPNDVEITNHEIFDLYFNHQNQYDRQTNHVFLNEEHYDGIVLFSKHAPVTEKEFEHRFYTNKKEHEVVASKPKKFDQFVVNNYAEYKLAMERSNTNMFWGIPDDVEVKYDFNLYFSHHNTYDRTITHVFKNDKTYDGLVLFSKDVELTEREVNHRFYARKKEWDIVASIPKVFDIFEIDSYEDYLNALENSKTELFWASSSNISILDLEKLENFYISHHELVDRTQNHSFIHRVDNKDYRNGIFLLSKHKKVSRKEIEYRFLAEHKEWNIILTGPVEYDQFTVENYDDYLFAMKNSKTELFWATSNNIDYTIPNVYFTHDNEYDRKNNHAFEHRVDDKVMFNGLFLLSKHKPVTEKEIAYRHIVGVKEWHEYGSQKTTYEYFKIDTYEQYLQALEKSRTEMFWGFSSNTNCDNFNFDLYFSHDNEYDRSINHNFIHRVGDTDYRNGVFLFSKKAPVTKKEIDYRHLVNVKEWDIVASGPVQYDEFIVETYEDYLEALKYSETEMFWMDSRNIKSEIPKIYFTHDNEYDRKQNHAFIHETKDKQSYNGLFLCSLHSPLTQKEIEHRFLVNAKQWDIVGSTAIEYPVYVIDSYNDYVNALEDSGPEMFWMSSSNIEAFIPDIYFTHDNEYDRKTNHSFIHRVNGKDYRNGLFLCSRHKPLTQKEVEHRFIVDAKEWDIVASGPKEYEYWEVDNYDDYLSAYNNCETEMFWMGSKNIKPKIPNLYFTHDNTYDRTNHHNFLHVDNTRNGLFLICRDKKLTEKEVEYRFIVDAKEWDIVGSTAIDYEKFVIETYDQYLDALENSYTEMFWGLTPNVDISKFNFDLYFTHDNVYDRKQNHAFLHCKDKFNGIFLFSKHKPVTQKEIEHRHLIERKEWTDRCTGPIKYDVFEIDNFAEYQTALNKSTTEMFWMSSKNITANIPDLYFTHDNEYDRNTNHNFLHCGDKRNGLFLCSKKSPLTQKEVEHRFLVNAKEWDIEGSGSKAYDYFDIDSYDEYLDALESSSTELFWMGSRNIEPIIPDLYFTHDNEYDRSINHAFEHCGKYNGLFLCSKQKPLSSKEVEYRHIVNAKEWNIVGSKEKEYDIFVVDSYNDYLNALDNTSTEMFWGTSANIAADIPNLYFTHDNEYDRKQNHNFIHRVDGKDYRNGLFLFSKHKPVTEREINYRYLVNAKEWDIVASGPVEYEHFTINSYNDYLEAMDKSKTEMFWGVPSDVAKLIYFRYDMLYFTHDNEYDRKTNHIMLNGEHRDGIVLFSKHAPVTQKEVENRFYVNKKDWEIVASIPNRYDLFNIETYDEYLEALENSTTGMFWASTPNIKISKEFDLDLYFSHHNTYDRKINHAFVHRANGENQYNGLFLLSKHAPLTQREIEHRLVAKRKEWDIVASGPVEYDKFTIDNYADYENALQESTTEMFWMIPPEVNIDPNFNFDLYFTHNQWFERETNHVFKNGDAWDGISLVSKKSHITEREISMRFLADKKQYEIVASTPNLYDIVFISKDEEHADKNYKKLVERFPRAKRVHGVDGIHAAHIEAAKLCDTDMIWIVDADAEIIDKFAFDYYVPAYDPDSRRTVHVWKSQNPINSLVYGYGAVKLLPRELTLNMDTSKPDMTTSISPLFKTINRISNITKFNTDEFSTWRSAFRETVKLSSRTIKGQLDEETEFRLKVWCTRGKDKPFGEYCIAGALAGKAYGEANRGDISALSKINDFEWLRNQFDNLKDSL